MLKYTKRDREIIDLEKTELLATHRPHLLKAWAQTAYGVVSHLFSRSRRSFDPAAFVAELVRGARLSVGRPKPY